VARGVVLLKAARAGSATAHSSSSVAADIAARNAAWNRLHDNSRQRLQEPFDTIRRLRLLPF
jgi:hypothetical protein